MAVMSLYLRTLYIFWTRFKQQLTILHQFSISRYVCQETYELIQLHRFADASEEAYNAYMHMCSVNKQGGAYTI